MRTTIEIPDDLRERLLVEAHRSGRRGYSEIVEEALRRYFSEYSDGDGRTSMVHELYGSERNDTKIMDVKTRKNWRTGR